MRTEDIVEVSENENEDSDCVLEFVTYENNIEIMYKQTYQNNPLLAELIDTCFNLDNSESMKKVINTIFLERFTKTDKMFRESQEFVQALRRTINLVKNDSSHKFTHIRDLCEILKKRSSKKRIQLTTLSNKSKDNEISLKRKCDTERNSKIAKTEIIDLDSSENDFIIDLDSCGNNFKSDCTFVEKENDTSIENRNIDEDELLVPHSTQVQELGPTDDHKIERLEQKIKIYKKYIAQLEEQEVCDDSMNSPYIQSENYKARIVSLYKEVCKLTGTEVVKQSTVHLKVLEGHPSGPVRRLEAFLNKNVGSDGHPPFPCFRDVVKCVLKANEQDGLGWSKQQIMNEATILFTHCGRALQRRRQRREWRHLVSGVQVERDPADSDPALLARLEQNRRDAAGKEAEILERFTMMQNAPPQKVAISNQVANTHESSNETDIDSSSDESSTKDEQNVNLPSQVATSSDNSDTSTDASEVNSGAPVVKIKKERESNMYQLLQELGDNYTTTVVHIEDSHVSIEISDSSDEDSDL